MQQKSEPITNWYRFGFLLFGAPWETVIFFKEVSFFTPFAFYIAFLV